MDNLEYKIRYEIIMNGLRAGVSTENILLMMGEKPPTSPAETFSGSAPTVEAPAPKATVKRRITGQGTSEELIAKIKQLSKEGYTVKQICDITGVSDPTVRKYKLEAMHETTSEPNIESATED